MHSISLWFWLWPFCILFCVFFHSISEILFLIEQQNGYDQRTRGVAVLTSQNWVNRRELITSANQLEALILPQ